MSAPLVLDIETLPLASSLALPYDPATNPPPANYKSAEAIEGHHARGAQTWAVKIAKMASLNPRLGRVLCLGTSASLFYAQEENQEGELLADFWRQAACANGYVVTWNGSFDLRFLLVRSIVQGIVPTVSPATIREWFRKYHFSPHFDVKAALLNWDVRAEGEGLDEWAKVFGLPGKPDGIDGSSVAFMHAEGLHYDLKAYCAADVFSTQAIYQRIAPYFGSV